MSTQTHNRAELPALTKLRDDTGWYLSEKAGYDLTQSAEGRKQIETAMAEIILAGWGAWQETQARLASHEEILSEASQPAICAAIAATTLTA